MTEERDVNEQPEEQPAPPAEPQAAPEPPAPAPAPEASAAAPEASAEQPAAEPGEAPPRPRAPRADGEAPAGDGEGARPERRRRHFGRRKVCAFCVDKVSVIDYKDPGKLRRYLSDRGRIESRRKTGTCAKHQRWLATALKRARHLALLPYTPEHIRVSGVTTGRR